MQAAIEARAVTCRTRGEGFAVRDISLTVGQGELVAIIGGSGSGKTTLLDALSGLRRPTSGTVLREPGRPAGYVPAGDSIDPVLPLGAALRYTAALSFVAPGRGGSRGDSGAVAETLRLVGLTAQAGVPVGALNPGMRKRAEIAAELLVGPAALFLGEPTAALDPAQATHLLRLLRRLADEGTTVVLTTSSPLDAAGADKVAMLAAGGHLAFFGTPAAARGYFGADSLEEIYERLAGLGDPTAAWSRRFLYAAAATRAPSQALLVPDLAGPHSAGRPSLLAAGDADPEALTGLDLEPDRTKDPAPGHPDPEVSTGIRPRARSAGLLRPARQLPVLVRRNAEVLARARRRQAILVAAPLTVLLALCVLLAVGALNGPAAVTLAWAILGGFGTGLAYELPARGANILRRERFTGLSLPAFLTAKAAILLPPLAAADLIIAAVPALANRLQAGFGLSYLAVLAASAIGLAAATAAATLFPQRPRG